MDYQRNRHAQELFDGIADQYNWVPDLFSFFQYRRWRRDLVSRLQAGPHSTVLDVCTGPAGVAMLMAQSHRCRVVGVDLSPEMLRRAQHNISSKGLTGQVPLVMGRVENLAFASESFDAVSVTFLLRYVDDAESTMREIVSPVCQVISLFSQSIELMNWMGIGSGGMVNMRRCNILER